jgi:hypothetical protein
MVRAILAGQKTQTRRVIKPQPDYYEPDLFRPNVIHPSEHGRSADPSFAYMARVGEDYKGERSGYWNTWEVDCDPLEESRRWRNSVPCPYGTPGDLLWVGETWAAFTRPTYEYGESDEIEGKISGDYLDHNAHPCLAYKADSLCWDTRWRASIHMPRWASRITLRVKSLRVERAQDISEEDAKAEGVSRNWIDGDFKGFAGTRDYDEALDGWLRYGCGEDDIPCDTARDSFASLWDAIHGQTFPWQSNPWVWVVEFEVVK